VIGPAKWEKLRQAEELRVQQLPGRPWNYKLKYPDTWSAEIDKKLEGPMHTICVTRVCFYNDFF
jgi:hypothetical protein